MKKTLLFLGFLALAGLAVWTIIKKLSQPTVPNTFSGKVISIDNLEQLLPTLPPTEQASVNAWLNKPETEKLLEQLLAFKSFPDWQTKKKADDALLSALKLPNLSTSNYVFKIPEQNLVVKIAGPANRLQSVLAAHGFWPGEQPTKPITKVDTFQTASRAAYYLILKELIEKQGLHYIDAPETYLVRFPSSSKSIDDEHAFILQKALPAGAKQLTPELAKTLSDEAVRETVLAIIGGGLWSIKNNLFLDPATNKLHVVVHLVDIEQPNNSAPADFFHKDPVRYYGNLRAGLEEFIDLFAGNPEKLHLIRSLIESNPVFNSSSFYPRYKKELTDVLNTKAPQTEGTALAQ